ncbi:ATP phosphoribosyltransferase regulatory subunit [Streptococcus sp. DD12]|uniref:ATP phosphoribosyltransferase regulatory subunit n=1 Tax=Streptococcus sp. DD12 TaxID=1777880 RepID=UPI000796737A|nr:ATP phosphoribosyltransferase regulatory subunit [Streptococcus sp. DD12]KXT75632.1 ATP phosphoribosyltransferase regulatory subunit [Streptococcus sp. DD12]
MKKTTLPTGMHDKLFKRARMTYQMERSISDLLMADGFHRIETPTLEHFEVFSDQVERNHYNLFDQQGELLALRPDVTSQIGRVIASTQVETPIKFSYSGKVFTYNEELRGLENEHTQAGVEIIGYPVDKALPEAILSAKEALEVAQVPAYRFEFSHAGVLQTIFDQLQLDAEKSAYLYQAIKDKNITQLTMFTKEHPSVFSPFLQELPYLFGESQTVLKRARDLVQDQQVLSALSDLELLLLKLDKDLGTTNVDLGQIPTMPYYTGVMFKVFGDAAPDAFVSGGRYDQLFERFGAHELTAVGWAIDIDLVYQAVHAHMENGGAQ